MVVVGEDNWETVMVLVGLVKGLETVWEELIWPYLTVLYPRADLSLLTCCWIVFGFSLTYPPGVEVAPVLCIAPVVFLTLCEVGRFAASWMLCRFVQRGRAGTAQVDILWWNWPSIWHACSRFLASTGWGRLRLRVHTYHCQSSGCVWNHPWLGALREACALVLLKSSCLQERAELRHKNWHKRCLWKKTVTLWLPFDVSGDTDKTRLNLVTHSPVCGSFPALDSLSVLVVLIFLEVWSLHLCFAWGKDKQSYGTKNARHCVSPY